MALRASAETIGIGPAGKAGRIEKHLSRDKLRPKERSRTPAGVAVIPTLLQGGTGPTNVVYGRRDGATGRIDPSAHRT